jgi:hypothetical protein
VGFELNNNMQRKNIICTILLFAFSFSAFAKVDSIPSRETLFGSLKQFHIEQVATNLAATNIREKFKWLDWLPSIGFGYTTVSNQLRPSVNFSASQFVNSYRMRELRKAETQKILRGSILNFKVDSIQLEDLLKKRESVIVELDGKQKAIKQTLQALEDIAELETADFQLQEKRNNEGQITPSNWLKLQAAYIRSQMPLISKKEELKFLEINKAEEIRNLEVDIRKAAKL